MAPNFINRWVFSPLESVPSPMIEAAQTSSDDPAIVAANVVAAEKAYPPTDQPVCRQYAQMWNDPWHENGFALVSCMLDPTHLAAAQADNRLIVFDSITSTQPADPSVINWVNSLATVLAPNIPQASAVPPTATLADVLQALEHLHVNFMPEQ